MLGYTNGISDNGKLYPESNEIFTSNCGRLYVNDQIGYCIKDVRTHIQTDPRNLNLYNEGGLDALGSSTGFTAIPESGINGLDSQPRFSKVADPLDNSKKAFRLSLAQGDASTGGLRIEFSHSGTGLYLPRGKNMWLAFAFLTPSSWKTVDKDLVGNPNAQHDETIMWQMHDVADGGEPTNHQPNMYLTMYGGGAGHPELSDLHFSIRDNPEASSNANTDTLRQVWYEKDYPADVWQYWIINTRLHWDSTYEPFTKAWRRVGYTGDYKLMFEDYHPNQYNNVTDDYQKAGIYYYADAWTGGVTTRTLHHKGLYSWMEDRGSLSTPKVTLSEVADFMDKI